MLLYPEPQHQDQVTNGQPPPQSKHRAIKWKRLWLLHVVSSRILWRWVRLVSWTDSECYIMELHVHTCALLVLCISLYPGFFILTWVSGGVTFNLVAMISGTVDGHVLLVRLSSQHTPLSVNQSEQPLLLESWSLYTSIHLIIACTTFCYANYFTNPWLQTYAEFNLYYMYCIL